MVGVVSMLDFEGLPSCQALSNRYPLVPLHGRDSGQAAIGLEDRGELGGLGLQRRASVPNPPLAAAAEHNPTDK